jgi:hypothetical protein
MYFSNTDLLEVPAIWSFQPARSRRAASLDAAAVVPSKSCTIFKKKKRRKTRRMYAKHGQTSKGAKKRLWMVVMVVYCSISSGVK